MSSSERLLRLLRSKIYRWRHRSTISTSGKDNRLELNDSLLAGCRIEVHGNGNLVEFGERVRLWGVTIRLVGDNHRCRIGSHCRLNGTQFLLEDLGSTLEVGSETTMYAATLTAAEGKKVHIGAGCLVAQGADIRNTDSHSILDGQSKARLNHAADVLVADRVWIGMYAQVLKGVTIASKSVVASHAVVTVDVEEGVLVAGIPARVVKKGIDWDPRRLG